MIIFQNDEIYVKTIYGNCYLCVGSPAGFGRGLAGTAHISPPCHPVTAQGPQSP